MSICSSISFAENATVTDIKVLSNRTASFFEKITKENFDTPLRTFETLIRGLTERNFDFYLSCFSEKYKKENYSSDIDIKKISEQFKKAEFKFIGIESMTLLLTNENPTMSVMLKSMRRSAIFREQLTITFLKTSRGWKIDKYDTKMLEK